MRCTAERGDIRDEISVKECPEKYNYMEKKRNARREVEVRIEDNVRSVWSRGVAKVEV